MVPYFLYLASLSTYVFAAPSTCFCYFYLFIFFTPESHVLCLHVGSTRTAESCHFGCKMLAESSNSCQVSISQPQDDFIKLNVKQNKVSSSVPLFVITSRQQPSVQVISCCLGLSSRQICQPGAFVWLNNAGNAWCLTIHEDSNAEPMRKHMGNKKIILFRKLVIKRPITCRTDKCTNGKQTIKHRWTRGVKNRCIDYKWGRCDKWETKRQDWQKARCN